MILGKTEIKNILLSKLPIILFSVPVNALGQPDEYSFTHGMYRYTSLPGLVLQFTVYIFKYKR